MKTQKQSTDAVTEKNVNLYDLSKNKWKLNPCLNEQPWPNSHGNAVIEWIKIAISFKCIESKGKSRENPNFSQIDLSFDRSRFLHVEDTLIVLQMRTLAFLLHMLCEKQNHNHEQSRLLPRQGVLNSDKEDTRPALDYNHWVILFFKIKGDIPKKGTFFNTKFWTINWDKPMRLIKKINKRIYRQNNTNQFWSPDPKRQVAPALSQALNCNFVATTSIRNRFGCTRVFHLLFVFLVPILPNIVWNWFDTIRARNQA